MPQADPKLPPGTNLCQCGACGEYFNSVLAFEYHRRQGRCLSTTEMTEKGMAISDRGYWVTKAFKSGAVTFPGGPEQTNGKNT